RLIQQFRQTLPKLIRRRVNHARRNLFASDFEQKVGHCLRRARLQPCRSAPTASGALAPEVSGSFARGTCAASHALATPTASLRIRAITPTRSVTEIAPRASRILKRCEHFRHRSKAESMGTRESSPAFCSSSRHSASYMSKCFHVLSTSAASKLYTENCCSSASLTSPYFVCCPFPSRAHTMSYTLSTS